MDTIRLNGNFIIAVENKQQAVDVVNFYYPSIEFDKHYSLKSFIHYITVKETSDIEIEVSANISEENEGLDLITYEQWEEFVDNNSGYRIKTREEFIREFGISYRYLIRSPWNYNGKMDYLYGGYLTEREFRPIKAGYKQIHLDFWVISEDCIVEVPHYHKFIW